MMQTVVWVLFLLKVVYMTDYNAGVVCPDPVLWNTIGRYVCPGRKYFCLWDEIRLEFGEKCHATERLEQKGKRTVLNSGNFNKKSCVNTTFQPFTFNASGNTRCVYLKSLCSEEGQIKVDFNSTVEDSQCRCNHSGGYAPLGQTKNRCYCVPSMEDCTCYKKSCGMDEVLLPNYTCISKIEEIALQTKPCIELGIVTDRIPTRPTKDKPITNSAESGKDYTVVIFMKVSMLILCLACICIYKIRLKIEILYDKVINYCKPLKVSDYRTPIRHVEDEMVLIECEANKTDLSNVWFKNGKKIESNSEIVFKSDGSKYCLEMKCVKMADAGSYSFYKKNMVVAKLEVQEVEIVKQPKDVYTCFEGDTMEFICEVNTDRVVGIWYKDNSKFQTLPPHRILNHVSKKFILKICNVLKKDEGQYKFSIREDLSCTTVLRVLDMKLTELYYIRLVNLLKSYAAPVVRKIFDREFHPGSLKETLNKHFEQIKKLKRQRHLNQKEYRLLYPEQKEPASKKFDIRLMIVLLTNLANVYLPRVYPEKSDFSEVADLCRISMIRSELQRNYDGEVDQGKFNELWKKLSEAIGRQDESLIEKCERLKVEKIPAEDCEKYRANLEEPLEECHNSMESIYFVTGITNTAVVAARSKFSEMLPQSTHTLQTWINDKNIKDKLTTLKEDKELTDTEWQILFPSSDGAPLLEKMDLKIIIILLKMAVNILPHSKDCWKHLLTKDNQAAIAVLEYLNEQLSREDYTEVHLAVKCLTDKTYMKEEFLSDQVETKSKLKKYVSKEVARKSLLHEVKRTFEELLNGLNNGASNVVNCKSESEHKSSQSNNKEQSGSGKNDMLLKWEEFIFSDNAGYVDQVHKFIDEINDEEITTNNGYNIILSVLKESSVGGYGSVNESIKKLRGVFPHEHS